MKYWFFGVNYEQVFIKNPHKIVSYGDFSVDYQFITYPFIEIKNSSLDWVFFICDFRNSMASTGFISAK